ncbi:MAG TPA: nicotinate-nucleotide adenylyltransferase [Pyrinomonadaceae bacterium]|nr:nicotinate-nucleotide adenylyltransferase [Pyrinomonadaceae bacterium]
MTSENAGSALNQRKRIAIYGGTFDPVHAGHLEIARRVTQLFAIDEFLFVPARIAPHKLDREVSPPLHRYAMLALVTQTDPRLLISTFELDEPERRYTVDTLAHFRSRSEAFKDLFFVMGADSWSEITTWREWERLMTLAHLIVVTRPGTEFSTGNVGESFAERVVDLRGQTGGGDLVNAEPDRRRIFVTDVVMSDVSATQVRRTVREGLSQELDKLVPVQVANYIRKYRLYRNKHEQFNG